MTKFEKIQELLTIPEYLVSAMLCLFRTRRYKTRDKLIILSAVKHYNQYKNLDMPLLNAMKTRIPPYTGMLCHIWDRKEVEFRHVDSSKDVKYNKSFDHESIIKIKNQMPCKSVDIIINSDIILNKNNFSDEFIKQIKNRLSFKNPKYITSCSMGFYAANIPKYLELFEEDGDLLYIPRGYLKHFIELCDSVGLNYNFVEDYNELPEQDFEFCGVLKDLQVDPVETTLLDQFGVLVAPCGSGKTVMALYIIAQRRQPTIIVTHTKDLLNQWINRIYQFLNIPKSKIGVIGCGKNIIKPITVAMVQTLAKRDLKQITPFFGQIIVDECQHTPATTFTKVIFNFSCFYMLGLSATPYRKDKLDGMIFATLGGKSGVITNKQVKKYTKRLTPEVISRETDFSYNYKHQYEIHEKEKSFSGMITEMIHNEDRNQLIISDIITEYENGNYSLILSDRKEHCRILSEILTQYNIENSILTSDIKEVERKRIINAFENKVIRILIATGQLAGEGLDIPILNRLFFATPVIWKGRVRQYVGRMLRNAQGKEDAKLYEYVDVRIDVLRRSFESRLRNIYSKL